MQLFTYLRRLFQSKSSKPITAEEVLATMISVENLPSVDERRPFESRFSAPCVLAQLQHDGSLLEHGEIAIYHFETKEWREFPKGDRKIGFPATHYRIAE